MKIFIGCSSKNSIDEKYLRLAKETAILLKDYDLVFGASSTSMMGEVFKTFKSNNKNITAVTTTKYKDDLVNLKDSTNYVYNTTMQRTNKIYEEADVFLILPGGIGTLAELCNIIEENRTNNYKKIIIYNYEGFYDLIFDWLKQNKILKFSAAEDIKSLIIVDNKEDLIKNLERND